MLMRSAHLRGFVNCGMCRRRDPHGKGEPAKNSLIRASLHPCSTETQTTFRALQKPLNGDFQQFDNLRMLTLSIFLISAAIAAFATCSSLQIFTTNDRCREC